MVLGKVIGNLLATIKKPELVKYKLLIIEPVSIASTGKSKDCFVAIDLVGAGIGDQVVVLQGSQVQNALQEKVPADAAIVGIVESMNVEQAKR